MSIIDYPFGPFNMEFFPWFYVGAFDAVGDGIADDAPAINAALAEANSNGGGTVLLGPQSYRVNSSIYNNYNNVNLMGMGQGTSNLIQGFTPSANNPAVLYQGPNAQSNIYQQFSIVGPGNSATGSVPGPTTPSAPALGTGWGFLAFGGRETTVLQVATSGCYHGFGAIIFGTTKFQYCTAGMGGAQVNPQFGFFAMGPLGAASTGTFTIGGTPTAGDTLSVVLDDGQGDVITVGPYTLTSADGGNVNHTAASFATFINNSDAVVGPLATWNQCAAGGAAITLSIDVPTGATNPTFTPSQTGGHTTVTPNTLTLITVSSQPKNPVSQVIGFSNCSVPQAQSAGNASTEGIHIDGGTTSIGIDQFGTTGNLFGIRLVNEYSGSDHDPQFVDIKFTSGDHTRNSAISVENGNDVNILNPHIIANFGQGPPPQSYAINIGPQAGGWNITNPTISSSDSAGIGIATGSGTITNPRIVKVGRNYLSGINLYGSAAIVGLTIKGGKIGANDLSSGGGGSNAYAIDLAGPGTPTVFTGTVQSLTIEDVDVTGAAGAINRGTIVSGSIAAFGLDAYITIDNNPGDFPLLDVAQPMPVNVAGVYSVINPFVSRRSVLLVPDGSHAITSYVLTNSDGATTLSPTLGNGVSITVSVGPNESLAVHGTTGWSLTWFWS